MNDNYNINEIISVFREELILINSELRDKYINNSPTKSSEINNLMINSIAFRIAEHSGKRILELGDKAIELYEKTISFYKIQIIDNDFLKNIEDIIVNLLKQICSDSRRGMSQFAASRGMEHLLNINTYQIEKVLENKIPPIIEKIKIITKKHNILNKSIIYNNNYMKKDNSKFIELIDRYEALLKRATFENRYKDDYDTLKIEAEIFIASIFGEEELKRYRGLPKIKGVILGQPINYEEELKEYKNEISKIISKLKGYNNIYNDLNMKTKNKEENFDKIFIVHGHNETMKQSIARLIEKQKIESVILHEKPNKGKTIIEKFELNADVGSAVVIFSGDDYGYEKNIDKDKAILRPRQNVIFEMGYFIGKLGREKVICIFEENIDIDVLSDYKGIIYIPYDTKGVWKYSLGKELKEIGFNFDLNKI